MNASKDTDSILARPKSASLRRKRVENANEDDPKSKTDHSVQSADHNKVKTNMSFWGAILEWDVSITSSFGLCVDENSSYGSLRPLMKALEISCHGVPWLIFAIIGILSSHKATSLEFLVNLLMGLVLDLLILVVLKTLVRRPRPAHNRMDMFGTISVDHYSFPSGHTTRAIMLLFFIADQISLVFPFGILLIAWAAAVCISRVLLGRHHVLDVIAGVFVGYYEFYLVKLLWLSPEVCMKLLQRIHEETWL